MVATFQITGADSSRYFAAVLGLTISTTTISYLFIFPALVRLRYSRQTSSAPTACLAGWRARGSARLIPTFWALVATVFLLWPGLGVNWFGAGPERQPGRAHFSSGPYELSQIVPLAVM